MGLVQNPFHRVARLDHDIVGNIGRLLLAQRLLNDCVDVVLDCNTAPFALDQRLAGLLHQTDQRSVIGAEQLEVASLIGGRRSINPSADLDEATLTQIAELTGGRYFRAKDTAALQDIYRLVDELEPVDEPESGFRPVRSFYYWPLGGAFALAALMAIVTILRSFASRRLIGAQADAG